MIDKNTLAMVRSRYADFCRAGSLPSVLADSGR